MAFARAQPADASADAVESDTPTQSSLFGRSIWYVAATATQLLAAVAVSPVLAHALGPDQFGRQALTVAVYQVLILVAQVGMDQAIWVYRARVRHSTDTRALLAGGCALAFLLGVVMLATMNVWGTSLGFDRGDSLLLAAVLWAPAGASTIMVTSLLLAEDKLAKYVSVTLTYALGGQLLGLIFVFAVGRTAVTFTWGLVISQYTALLIGLVVSKPVVAGVAQLRRLWTGLQVGLPVMLSQMAVFVLNSSDRIVVQRELGSSETGRYQVAYIIGSVLVLVLGYLNQSWGPRFLVIADGPHRRRMIAASRDDLYRLLTPAVVGLTLAAPLVLRVLAPSSFRPESLLPVVFFIVASAYPFAAAGASRRELMALGRLRVLVVAAGIAAALNIALNLVLVPHLQLTGSAIATLVAFAAQAFTQRLFLHAERLPGVSLRVGVEAALATAAAAATVFLPQTDSWVDARFAVSLALLAWLVVRLRSTRLAGPKQPEPAGETAPQPGRRRTPRPGRHRRPSPRPGPSTEAPIDTLVGMDDVGMPRESEGRHGGA